MKKLILVTMLSTIALTGCEKKEEVAVQEPVKTEETATETTQVAPTENAEESKVITVENLSIRSSFPGQDVASAYLTLKNSSDKDIEVTSVSSNVSKNTEFHTMSMDGGKMVMRGLEKVVVPAGGSFVLKPKGDHIMFMKLATPVVPDDEVAITFGFDDGTTLSVSGKAAPLDNGMKDEHAGHGDDAKKEEHKAHAEHKAGEEHKDHAKQEEMKHDEMKHEVKSDDTQKADGEAPTDHSE